MGYWRKKDSFDGNKSGISLTEGHLCPRYTGTLPALYSRSAFKNAAP